MSSFRKRRANLCVTAVAAAAAVYASSQDATFSMPQVMTTVRSVTAPTIAGTKGNTAVASAANVGRQCAFPSLGLSCAVVGLGVIAARRHRQTRGAVVATKATGAGGAIETYLVRGPVDMSKLALKCASLAAYFDLQCVTFFSLGVNPDIIASVAGGSLGLHGVCPVYIADTAGIVGWDDQTGANVELRSDSEESGVVVVAFRGGGHEPSSHTENEDIGEMPSERALHMIVRAAGKPETQPSCGAVYGGIAKACYKLEHSGDLVPVTQFAVSTPMAVLTSFKDDAATAVGAAMGALPPVATPPLAAGYFPSTTRDDKDSIASGSFSPLDNVRLFGMFADTLAPPACGKPLACVPELLEWTSILDPDPRPAVELDSKTSVLALYGK